MSDYDPFAGLPFGKPSQGQRGKAPASKSTPPNAALSQAGTVLLVLAAAALWWFAQRGDIPFLAGRQNLAILLILLVPFVAISSHHAYQAAFIRHELNERFTIQLGLPTNHVERLVKTLTTRRVRVATPAGEGNPKSWKLKARRLDLRQLKVRYPNRVRSELLKDLSPFTSHVSDMFDGADIHATIDRKRRVIVFTPAPPPTPVDEQVARIQAVAAQVFREAKQIDIEGLNGAEFEKVTLTFGSIGATIAATPAGRTRLLNLMQSRLDTDLRARWDLGNDRVTFSPRPDFPGMILNTPDSWPERIDTHTAYKQMRIPFGVDENGEKVEWQPSVIPHGLVIGGTGSGKTACLHTVTAYVSRYFQTWILDGKNTEFVGFRDWPNVEYIAQGPEQQAWMIAALHRVMLWRNGQIEAGLLKVEELEPIFVIIDEYASFREAVKGWWSRVKTKGDPAQPPFLEYVGNLARLARTAKIHMLIGIQRPDTTLLPGEVRDNLMFRVSLGNLGVDGSLMCWNNPIIGTAPRSGPRRRGRGVAGYGKEGMEPGEFLGFYTPDPKSDLNEKETLQLEQLKAPDNRFPRRVLRPPMPSMTEEGETVPPTWRDWEAAKRVLADSPEGQQILAEARAKAAASTPGIDEDEIAPGERKTTPPTAPEFALEYAPAAVPAAEGTVADEVGAWDSDTVPIEAVQVGDYIDVDGALYSVLDLDPDTDPSTVLVTAAAVVGGGSVDSIAFEPGETVTRHITPETEEVHA